MAQLVLDPRRLPRAAIGRIVGDAHLLRDHVQAVDVPVHGLPHARGFGGRPRRVIQCRVLASPADHAAALVQHGRTARRPPRAAIGPANADIEREARRERPADVERGVAHAVIEARLLAPALHEGRLPGFHGSVCRAVLHRRPQHRLGPEADMAPRTDEHRRRVERIFDHAARRAHEAADRAGHRARPLRQVLVGPVGRSRALQHRRIGRDVRHDDVALVRVLLGQLMQFSPEMRVRVVPEHTLVERH